MDCWILWQRISFVPPLCYLLILIKNSIFLILSSDIFSARSVSRGGCPANKHAVCPRDQRRCALPKSLFAKGLDIRHIFFPTYGSFICKVVLSSKEKHRDLTIHAFPFPLVRLIPWNTGYRSNDINADWGNAELDNFFGSLEVFGSQTKSAETEFIKG